MDALIFIFLLGFWSFTGVTSTDSPVMLYQLKSSSMCLHVRKTPSPTKGEWMFGETFIANEDMINPTYEGRVNFSPKNLTLCINQLSVEDTGIFKFSYFFSFIRTSEDYQVIVEDMVPRPVMTVTPENPSNISMGFCNFTVNCSIQNEWLSSICNKDGCTTTQRSLKNLNISIHTNNSTVTCSGNNHVSTNNVSENITTICVVKSNLQHKKELRTASSIYIFITFIILTSVLLCTLFFVLVRRLQKNHNQETTAVAQLIQSGPLETQQQSEVRVSTTSSEAEPSYENVEATPSAEKGISRDEHVFSESQMVDTVYSVPRKVDSFVKSDKKSEALGDGKTQTTSGSVNRNTEQSLTQTETVYSVLEMPKNLKS